MPNLAELLGISHGSKTGTLEGISNGLMPPAVQDPNASWYRPDGSKKGRGFLGELKHKSGGTSTELSIGVDIGGKEVEIPSLVPTLSKEEIDHLLSGGEPTDEIVKKAVEHAKIRMGSGLSVFSD